MAGCSPDVADSAGGSDSQTYLVRTSLRGWGGFLADVELRTIKEVDMKGGTVVAAFPSVGLVSTITATYLITTLPTDQVTALESPDFPSISQMKIATFSFRDAYTRAGNFGLLP